MTRRREEFMDQLSEAELAELSRHREEMMRSLSPEQLEQM